jgi:hypothetical protein
MKKTTTLALIIIIGLGVFAGCGSDDSSSSYRAEPDIRTRFTYFNKGYISTRNDTRVCVQGPSEDSYTIEILAKHVEDHYLDEILYNTVLTIQISEYRRSGCGGSEERIINHEYHLSLGEETNGGTRLEATIRLTKPNFETDAIRILSEKVIFGRELEYAVEHFTELVGQGGLQTDTLKYGFAQPTVLKDGNSASSRADDISAYSAGKQFLIQI